MQLSVVTILLLLVAFAASASAAQAQYGRDGGRAVARAGDTGLANRLQELGSCALVSVQDIGSFMTEVFGYGSFLGSLSPVLKVFGWAALTVVALIVSLIQSTNELIGCFGAFIFGHS